MKIASILIILFSLSCKKEERNLFGIKIGGKFNKNNFKILKEETSKPFKSWLYGKQYRSMEVKTVPIPEEGFGDYTISVNSKNTIFGIYASRKSIKTKECVSLYRKYKTRFTKLFGEADEVENDLNRYGISSTWNFSKKPKSYVSIACYGDEVSIYVQNYKLNF